MMGSAWSAENERPAGDRSSSKHARERAVEAQKRRFQQVEAARPRGSPKTRPYRSEGKSDRANCFRRSIMISCGELTYWRDPSKPFNARAILWMPKFYTSGREVRSRSLTGRSGTAARLDGLTKMLEALGMTDAFDASSIAPLSLPFWIGPRRRSCSWDVARTSVPAWGETLLNVKFLPPMRAAAEYRPFRVGQVVAHGRKIRAVFESIRLGPACFDCRRLRLGYREQGQCGWRRANRRRRGLLERLQQVPGPRRSLTPLG
jgi:hypothetical protein